MSSRTTTTAALVAAATALAGGAYALGSQSDGSAEAAKATAAATPAPFGRRGWHDRGGPGAGLSDLASRLGVPEAKLRVALQDLRGTDPGDLGARQASLISSIASSLKVSEAEVKAAFNAVRKQGQGGPPGLRSGPDELAATLAKQLGVSQAKVRTALDTAFQAQRESHVDEIAGTLATALKVDKAKVAAALAALRPAPGSGPRDHPPGDGGIAAALARKLGVPVADVRAALQKLRTQRELQMSAARDAFAVNLADKLGISAAKVKSALNDHGPFGLHDGPGGRGGHGGGFFRHR
jgi:hypothetical protein